MDGAAAVARWRPGWHRAGPGRRWWHGQSPGRWAPVLAAAAARRTGGDGLFEALEPRHQAVQIGAGGIVGQLHEGDFEQQPRVGCVAHLDQHLAEPLHRPDDRRRAEPRLASDDTSSSRCAGSCTSSGAISAKKQSRR